MKTQKKYIEEIKQNFSEIDTRQDLLYLINYANQNVSDKSFRKIKLKQLTYYSIPPYRDKSYKKFSVSKKSGKNRTICSPNKELKNIQKGLSIILQCLYKPNKSAKGFIPGYSVVDNAKAHLNQNYVFNIDLKDFFSSIEQARVWACLKLSPYNLIDNEKSKNDLRVESGVRILYTDHNEKIHYKIINNEVEFVIGIKDDREKFIKRINDENLINQEKYVKKLLNKNTFNEKEDEYLSYFDESEFKYYFLLKVHQPDYDLKKFKTDYGHKGPYTELQRLVFTESNIKKLRKLQSSRILINNTISNLCCVNMLVERKDENGNTIKVEKSVLPQGAPTSPILSNIVCNRLDFLLNGLAKRFNLNYTRYADDVTFSSMHNVYKKNGSFFQELERIVKDQGFEIKDTKTRLQPKSYRQEVTGVVVNDKLNVRRRYIKQIRMWLYYWDKYGYEKAESLFKKDYIKDKGHVKNIKAKLENVLFGKLEYLKMVKGNNDSTYLKLNKKFEKLKAKSNSINKVLDTWEKEGIDNAIEHYKKINNKRLEYIELKKYFLKVEANSILIKNDKVLFLNNKDKVIDTIIISIKAKSLITESILLSYLNDKTSIYKWYIVINEFKNTKFIFMKKWGNSANEQYIMLEDLLSDNK